MACEHGHPASWLLEYNRRLEWCNDCGAVRVIASDGTDDGWTVPGGFRLPRAFDAAEAMERLEFASAAGSFIGALVGKLVRPDRVPGPLAAGPGGSGLTRGASDAEKGVEAHSPSREGPRAQEPCEKFTGSPLGPLCRRCQWSAPEHRKAP